MIGKWDLAGHNLEKFNPDFMPTHQGLDYSFFTPASNDARPLGNEPYFTPNNLIPEN